MAEGVGQALLKNGYLDDGNALLIPVLKKVDEELCGKVPAVRQVAFFVDKMVEFARRVSPT